MKNETEKKREILLWQLTETHLSSSTKISNWK